MTIVNSNRKKPIYGVGINDADYSVTPRINGKQVMCPFYKAWKSMITRCYSKALHKQNPTYIGCTVIKEWRSFMIFRRWMIEQNWQGKHLDKDIVYPGNKVYSPEKCVFVTQSINKLLLTSGSSRGKWPLGVIFDNQKKKFRANLAACKKQKHLGFFNNPKEASLIYREAKRLYLLRIACCEPDIRVKQGLYRHSLTYL